MRKKTYDDDDGRVIANMNIEGAPWYVKGSGGDSGPVDEANMPDMKQTWHIITGALAAGLVIGFVFIAAFFLFILFCTKVWFR